jgi:hypothetical protein
MKFDHIKNGQKYAVFMDRLKLYGDGSPTNALGSSPSPRLRGGESPTEGSHFQEIIKPSPSPRCYKASKLDIKDIPGAQSSTNKM